MKMKITVAENAGFCFGVKRAIEAAYQNVYLYDKLYTYGDIIHNPSVISELKKKGIHAVDDLDTLKGKENTAVIIRSHGSAPDVYEKLNAMGITVIDATCPFVKRIHEKVKDASGEGKSVVIIGAKEHPEVIGIKGWSDKDTYVLETLEDAQRMPALKKAVVVAQTTITKEKWDTILDAIRHKIDDMETYMSVCATTFKRQNEATNIAKNSDVMIVIGGKSSSNTNKLYEICTQYCSKVYYIEEYKQLSLEKINVDDIIGIVAGASTPDWIIREVYEGMSENEKLPVAEPEEDIQEKTAGDQDGLKDAAQESSPEAAEQTAAKEGEKEETLDTTNEAKEKEEAQVAETPEVPESKEDVPAKEETAEKTDTDQTPEDSVSEETQAVSENAQPSEDAASAQASEEEAGEEQKAPEEAVDGQVEADASEKETPETNEFLEGLEKTL